MKRKAPYTETEETPSALQRARKALEVSLRDIQEWKTERGESVSLGLLEESEYLDGLIELKDRYLQLMKDVRNMERRGESGTGAALTAVDLARSKKRIKQEMRKREEDALIALHQHELPPDFWKHLAFMLKRDVFICFRWAQLSRMHYRLFIVENDFIGKISNICRMTPEELTRVALDTHEAHKISPSTMWGIGVEDPTKGYYHHWEWDIYLKDFTEGYSLGFSRVLALLGPWEDDAMESTRARYRSVLGWKWGNPVQLIAEYLSPDDDVDAEPTTLELLPGLADFIYRILYLKEYDLLDWWFEHDNGVPGSWDTELWCELYNLFYAGLYVQDYPLVTYLWNHQRSAVIESLREDPREDTTFIRDAALSGVMLTAEKSWFSWFHGEVTRIVSKMKASDVREQKIMEGNIGPGSDLESAGSGEPDDPDAFLDIDDPLVLRIPENIVFEYSFTYGGLDRGEWEAIVNWIEEHM